MCQLNAAQCSGMDPKAEKNVSEKHLRNLSKFCTLVNSMAPRLISIFTNGLWLCKMLI